MAGQCVEQGVSRIVVCDTTGGASPEEVTEVMGGLRAAWPDGRSSGSTGTRTAGLGVANTRAAMLAGAVQVQGTLLGTGERCGNVNLTTVVGGMQVRGEAEFVAIGAADGADGAGARGVWGVLAGDVPHGAPIVGPGAFGTWAGMHGSSEMKNPGAYLWCDPARVGRTPAIGVNGQSGRANVVLLSKQMGVALTSAQAQRLMDENQAMIEGGGFTASEVSFRLACMRVLGTLPKRFSVKGWRCSTSRMRLGTGLCRRFMTLSVGEQTVATSRAEGAGPVDALTKAMRQELEKWYPAMAQMKLGRSA
jgi:2-isopropylmalate synthase